MLCPLVFLLIYLFFLSREEEIQAVNLFEGGNDRKKEEPLVSREKKT